MPIVEESIVIESPVANVFTYLADTSNWPYWTSEVVEVKQTSAGQVGVGTTFQGVDRIMGFTVAWTARIIEYEVNKKIAQVITSGNRLVEQHLTLKPVEGSTSFLYDMKTSGLPSFISPILQIIMRKGITRNLRRLKAILES